MKNRDQVVSADKLRGGFYTPPPLVHHVVDRLSVLLGSRTGVRLLEPSVGDGQFLDGVRASSIELNRIVGVELDAAEAAKARTRLSALGLDGEVVTSSTLRWSLSQEASFDGVVGNLPFAQYQFISQDDRIDAKLHVEQLGVKVGGVSNLWLPMLLASLRLLKTGGVFALVLPTECLTGVSTGSAREWLVRNCVELRCDLYQARSFPNVEQEVLILSGRRIELGQGDQLLKIVQHQRQNSSGRFHDDHAAVSSHIVNDAKGNWTHFLLSPVVVSALDEFQHLPSVVAINDVARFKSIASTGDNNLFCMSWESVKRYDLYAWVRPLMMRTKYAPGLIFTPGDYANSVKDGIPAFIFDGELSSSDRTSHPGLDAFLTEGETQGVPDRTACRARSPWWQIPNMRRGELFFGKFSDRFQRMIVNQTVAVTTDVIYRGSMQVSDLPATALVAGFHNSGTLLCAEVGGRCYGGGVLELQASEVGRLSVPKIPSLAVDIARLDQVARADATANQLDALVTETDLLLVKADIGVTNAMVETLAVGRLDMLSRRLDRATVDRG